MFFRMDLTGYKDKFVLIRFFERTETNLISKALKDVLGIRVGFIVGEMCFVEFILEDSLDKRKISLYLDNILRSRRAEIFFKSESIFEVFAL